MNLDTILHIPGNARSFCDAVADTLAANGWTRPRVEPITRRVLIVHPQTLGLPAAVRVALPAPCTLEQALACVRGTVQAQAMAAWMH